jgi:ABC-2 type transport system ATP-binding protein
MDPVLQFEGLEKIYRPGLFQRTIAALRGLTFAVRPGEIYGLVGPNGAGKTTAFKVLLGLARPSGGGGSIFGLPFGHREARRRIGFLPELPSYYPHLTVREMLHLARALSGMSRNETADAKLFGELGLSELRDRPIRRLSKGQIQRVGLAQALVHYPELLILDEPMSGLDPFGRALVRDRLLRERQAGRAILLSSHVLADVEALADTVGLIAGGRLVVEGGPRELLDRAATAVTIEGSGTMADEVLLGIPGVSLCRRADAEWTVRLPNPQQFQIDALILRILRGGGTVQRIETEREDLEGFFLRRMAGTQEECHRDSGSRSADPVPRGGSCRS